MKNRLPCPSIRSISVSAIASIALSASAGSPGAVPPAVKTRVLRDASGSEAVVEPEFGGRVMSFSPRGAGRNVFWNAPAGSIDLNGWANHGGEKTWIGPQNLWPKIKGGPSWPPPKHFDSAEFPVESGSCDQTRSLSMASPAVSGGDACPFGVKREVSLEGEVLSVVARLVPSGCEIPEEAGLPAGSDDWHVWSIAQVPWSAEFAIRKTGLGRFKDVSSATNVFSAAAPEAEGAGVVTMAINPESNNGKIFFDGDAIAVGYPDGALVARRVPNDDDVDDYPFPLHGRAQLFTGWHGKRDAGGVRYLELEFTSVGTRPLKMEFSFVAGVSAEEALRR